MRKNLKKPSFFYLNLPGWLIFVTIISLIILSFFWILLTLPIGIILIIGAYLRQHLPLNTVNHAKSVLQSERVNLSRNNHNEEAFIFTQSLAWIPISKTQLEFVKRHNRYLRRKGKGHRWHIVKSLQPPEKSCHLKGLFYLQLINVYMETRST